MQNYNPVLYVDKPLYITIQRDNLECFREMISFMSIHYDNIFETVISPRSYNLTEYILKDYPSLLSYCTYFNASQIVDFILLNNTDISLPDLRGRTPAHFAAAGGNLQILLKLHEMGADFEAREHRV